jgi:mannose-6-phosphate isomerase
MLPSTPFLAYPLTLTYGVRRYAFGGRAIAGRLGKEGLPAGVVAETWEISDHDDEGAIVTNGPYRGRRLRELVRAFPEEVVHPGWRGPHLPLLVKFLDASHRLPVHVHPDDATAARRYGAPNGKSEAWHVLSAPPGASVLAGVRPGTPRDELRAACLAGAFDAVMVRREIASGDTVHVPGGVLHTFGPDTLIVEVQQTSDLSASVMPTDVYGRELQVEAWLANVEETLDLLTSSVLPVPHPGDVAEDGACRRVVGCVDPSFVLERWTLHEACPADPGRGGFATLSNVGERVVVEHAGGRHEVPRGTSILLPAALGEIVLHPAGVGDVVVCHGGHSRERGPDRRGPPEPPYFPNTFGSSS